jgi:AraC family transcriptional regulator, transcriptional activator of pobA
MASTQPFRIKTISDYHLVMDLPKPEHPLISLIKLEDVAIAGGAEMASVFFDFYSISLKRNFNAKVKYGQQEYDFNEGVMFFISPGQVFGIEVGEGTTLNRSGWLLLVHPDFLWNSPLAKTIKQYEFFDYSVSEALFLSEKEEATIIGMMQSIEQEYRSRIDKFSQQIIIAQLELLLKHAERFYERQFITRQISHHQMLARVEDLLSAYFNSDEMVKNGLPTVAYLAQSLNISSGYLSSLLKALTGLNAQQHIHQKLIDKAREKLSTTGLSVSEIAYELGFEHPQSFSKLFKTKTSLSPLEFRQRFN